MHNARLIETFEPGKRISAPPKDTRNADSKKVLVGWHVLVLAFMLLILFAPRDGGASIHWIWIAVLASPVLVLAATFAPISSQKRAILYWALALFTIPNAIGGILSPIGWLLIVSIIMLIWAARLENPAEEMVQF